MRRTDGLVVGFDGKLGQGLEAVVGLLLIAGAVGTLGYPRVGAGHGAGARWARWAGMGKAW